MSDTPLKALQDEVIRLRQENEQLARTNMNLGYKNQQLRQERDELKKAVRRFIKRLTQFVAD